MLCVTRAKCTVSFSCRPTNRMIAGCAASNVSTVAGSKGMPAICLASTLATDSSRMTGRFWAQKARRSRQSSPRAAAVTVPFLTALVNPRADLLARA